MYNNIINSCRYLLLNYPDAEECRQYITSRVSAEVQNIFQFGYFPDINNLQVLQDLLKSSELEENKLLYSKGIEDSQSFRTIFFSYFENYPLIMPFKDPYGNIVGIVARTLLSEEERKKKEIPKYKNTQESLFFKKGNLLFGLYENKKNILEQNCVYIVEGQFDVIKAYEKGMRNVVALGNSTMTSYQFSILTRYTDNIFLLLDNDIAGEKGREKIVKKFGNFANIRNFYLPNNHKDIDSFFQNNAFEDLNLILKE